MSFRVKSSHQFVNPSQQQETTQTSSYLDFSLTSSSTDTSTDTSTDNKVTSISYTPKTKTGTEVVSGSGKGMAVRTSITAMADYY